MSINYLNKIKSVDDFKKIPDNELDSLASEIREVIVNTVAENGGHLASNLGTVELTIAIHKAFSSPEDQIVFDVGHQSYTHKLLTGRYDRFSTLRKKDGLSGFTNPAESEHDVFISGHSSTSLSSSLGLAQAKKIQKDKSYTVSVIGDGSFTGGMVYEALNNAGKSNTNLIVILNDNKMSISENVGAFASYLAVIRSNPRYFKLKRKTEQTINKIPVVGSKISEDIFKIKTDVKNKLYNRSTFFEEIGFRYMGPVDGHNIKQLTLALESAKMVKKPVLLHIYTTKGKGFDFAEKLPGEFHGISGFDKKTGVPYSGGYTFSKALGDILTKEADKNPKICAVTAAMGIGTGLDVFAEKYPGRFFDVGIAEQHAVTFASGLAKNGMLPVFAVYSTFLQRSYDQLLHDISLQKLKVIFAVDRAGFVGDDGVTHQGLFDISYFNSLPNFKVYSPSDFNELEEAFRLSVSENEKLPVVIRYPRGGEKKKPSAALTASTSEYSLYGKTDNSKTLVVTYGRLTVNALEAFYDESSVCVLQLKLVKPLPEKAIKIMLDFDKVYFFEESVKNGSVGQIAAETLLENSFKGSYNHICVDNTFVEQATVEEQIKKYRLDSDSMRKRVNGEKDG